MSIDDKIEGLTNDMTTMAQHFSSADKCRMVSRIDGIEKRLIEKADDEAIENGWNDLIETKEKLRSAILSVENQQPAKSSGVRGFLYNRIADFYMVMDWFRYKNRGFPVPEKPLRLDEEEKEEEKELPQLTARMKEAMSGGGGQLPTG